MPGEHRGHAAIIRDNAGSIRLTHRREADDVTPHAPPQTVQDLAAAIIGVIRCYRAARGTSAWRDVTLALALADRENFRCGRP